MTMARFGDKADLLLAAGVVGILVLMVLPIPPRLLDMFLAFSITLSLVVLLVAMYNLRPLEFSAFPSLLLIITLFRLSLNIAATRLILLHGSEGVGAAGQVIKSFGQFVVGGDFVVGVIIFFVLIVINFVVITRGAGRIAEVAARFTLDAMPGKQMSIDADLNAGLINETEARQRRRAIEAEADFYGAMDGASKFVRGDAVAGVLITVINIVGGLAIGVLRQGMPILTAAQTYTILTIGDGLVTQIPALIVSTAAGIIVTRAASEAKMGQELTSQLLVHPRAMGLAAAILFGFGIIPGLPTLPFLILSGAAGAIAYATAKGKEGASAQDERARQQPEPPERIESLLPLDVLELQVGYALIPLVDVEQDGELLERIKATRRQFAQDMGIVVPPLHIRDNLQLKPTEYTILLKGVQIARGELMLGHYLAMNPGTAEGTIAGIPTREPAFGLPASWIPERDRERAQIAGYTVVNLATVIATHLTEVLKAHAHELLDRQAVQGLLDTLAQQKPKVVEELVTNLLSLGGVQKVLQNLVRERVSIRDLLTVVEALADCAPLSKDPETLTEYTRQRLSRSICRAYQNDQGVLAVMSLDPTVEALLMDAAKRRESGAPLALDPKTAQRLLDRLAGALEKVLTSGGQPVLLCSPVIRWPLRRFLEGFLPQLAVISHHEVAPDVQIQSTATVSFSDALETV
ncbi:MAG: flagellar biosynthesis protein FlhA [Nitrospinae bacterium]|nr:flagellar biosynthesis protein FlhA [Nitrospinota bacterium]